MKFIKKFNSQQNLNNYKNSDNVQYPNVLLANENNIYTVSYDKRYEDLEYLYKTVPQTHILINKKLGFIENHEYKIDVKFQWINNDESGNYTSPIIHLGYFEYSSENGGYRATWYRHSSNAIYFRSANNENVNYTGIMPKLSDNTNQLIEDSRIIKGITDNDYLTLYCNLRTYYLQAHCTANIYYVKITDITDNKLICDLHPKNDKQLKTIYIQDYVDNAKYYFINTINRESSDLGANGIWTK